MWCAVAASAAAIHAAPPIAIEVQETVGIRRFQYPVTVELKLPEAVARETPFRLLHQGKPVLAQVRPAQADAAVARWWLDFPVDLLPYQSAAYELQYGPDVTPGPLSRQGHKLIPSADGFRIANEPHIAWTVRRDLTGLLSSVRAGELEYLRGDSPGLVLWDRGGKRHPVGGSGSRPAVSVTREGPLAVGMRFEINENLPQVRCTVDLTFPVFKSWVEVDWRIDDPRGSVASAEAGFHLNVDPPTRQASTLVDFGTTGLVYLSLGPAQQCQLHGGSGPWQVLRGRQDRLEPYVAGPRKPRGRHEPPEGWAHVMDRRRCLAMAVHQFAMETEDRLGMSADGRVELRRSFPAAPASAVKRFRFWLHFVPFPPQEMAATSPQAMQNPVVARIRVAGHSKATQ
jgi:hypothetical protein